MWRHRAQQSNTPVKRKAVIAGLASEGLALILGSAEPGNSSVVGPMPTDPVELRKCARDSKALSAVKEYTNEERGGGRDPGVRRPGVGVSVCMCVFLFVFVCVLLVWVYVTDYVYV